VCFRFLPLLPVRFLAPVFFSFSAFPSPAHVHNQLNPVERALSSQIRPPTLLPAPSLPPRERGARSPGSAAPPLLPPSGPPALSPSLPSGRPPAAQRPTAAAVNTRPQQIRGLIHFIYVRRRPRRFSLFFATLSFRSIATRRRRPLPPPLPPSPPLFRPLPSSGRPRTLGTADRAREIHIHIHTHTHKT
jgi:hypothetical protein